MVSTDKTEKKPLMMSAVELKAMPSDGTCVRTAVAETSTVVASSAQPFAENVCAKTKSMRETKNNRKRNSEDSERKFSNSLFLVCSIGLSVNRRVDLPIISQRR